MPHFSNTPLKTNFRQFFCLPQGKFPPPPLILSVTLSPAFPGHSYMLPATCVGAQGESKKTVQTKIIFTFSRHTVGENRKSKSRLNYFIFLFINFLRTPMGDEKKVARPQLRPYIQGISKYLLVFLRARMLKILLNRISHSGAKSHEKQKYHLYIYHTYSI